MATSPTIAIDAMGGDHGPSVTVPATLAALAQYPDLKLLLIGDLAQIKSAAGRDLTHYSTRLILRHAPCVIEMDAKPSHILKECAATSMGLTLDAVRSGEADAAVSGGNTGALMVLSRHLLGMSPGISRPAICAPIPSRRGSVYLLDVGANVDSPPQHLQQFAHLGSSLATLLGRGEPRVALLNIGHEHGKGNEQVKSSDQLLKNDNTINYIGFIEAGGLLRGDADVVVCDGFVGNITLKSMEATSQYVAETLRAEFDRSAWRRILGFLVKPTIKRMKQGVDTDRYNGALFLGLKGLVLKSHGDASSASFESAISQARLCLAQNIISHMTQGDSSI
ncbi:MAG: glycerol-3-phosphate acyltransferase PlsX [Halieaceae bacterium]|jgi:glycerol-3-phosphate acyltransferase PlsX